MTKRLLCPFSFIVALLTLATLVALPLNVRADTLLIITSTRLPFQAATYLSEMAIGSWMKEKLETRYRKIYWYRETSEIPLLDLLNHIKHNRVGEEALDVFSIQHGPDRTIFPNQDPREIEKIFGREYLRSVFSSGCNMWGEVKINPWTGEIQSSSNYISTHLKNMGVRDFILLTNIYTSLPSMLSDLVDAIDGKSPWAPSFRKVFQAHDHFAAEAMRDLASAVRTNAWMSPTIFKFRQIGIYPAARPVFGVNVDLVPTTEKVTQGPQWQTTSQHDQHYTEHLLTYSEELQTTIAETCPILTADPNQARLKSLRQSICPSLTTK